MNATERMTLRRISFAQGCRARRILKIMDPIVFEDGAICLSEIRKSSERIRGVAKLTPVLTCESLDRLSDLLLFFKCEVFQKTGSFKVRGAFNAISQVPNSIKCVVAHSSGNHAAAVAYAAESLGISSTIVVPTTTPKIKQDAIASYGGTVILCDPTMEAREAETKRIQDTTGAAFIPPFNHPHVICGQGTIALEFLEQCTLDAIIVPISGGGMISGIAVAAKSINPSIKIFAAEPCGRDGRGADADASLKAKEIVKLEKCDTICDGLQARLGNITFPIIMDLVDGVLVVTEDDIVNAMRLCYERLKIVVEPSGAAGLAAAMKFKSTDLYHNHPVERVGVVLCGGNVDINGKIPGFWDAWLK